MRQCGNMGMWQAAAWAGRSAGRQERRRRAEAGRTGSSELIDSQTIGSSQSSVSQFT